VLRSETVSGPAASSDQFSQLLAQLADKVATGLCAASQPPPPPQALSGTLNVEITTKAAGVPPIQQNRTTVSTGHFPITYRRDYYDPDADTAFYTYADGILAWTWANTWDYGPGTETCVSKGQGTLPLSAQYTFLSRGSQSHGP
jgi:hypothetical protein